MPANIQDKFSIVNIPRDGGADWALLKKNGQLVTRLSWPSAPGGLRRPHSKPPAPEVLERSSLQVELFNAIVSGWKARGELDAELLDSYKHALDDPIVLGQ